MRKSTPKARKTILILFVMCAGFFFGFATYAAPYASDGGATTPYKHIEQTNIRVHGSVQKMKQAQVEASSSKQVAHATFPAQCCAVTVSGCPTTPSPGACSVDGYVRVNANGCHCSSDESFQKCFAASCAGSCPGSSVGPFNFDWKIVANWPGFEKLGKEGKIADFSCHEIERYLRGEEKKAKSMGTKVKEEASPVIAVEEKKGEDEKNEVAESDDGQCCQSDVKGCPTSGKTACSIGGYVRGSANGCYCPDVLGPDEFRKCFRASCRNACPGSTSILIDFRKVPLYEEMERLMEEGKLQGVGCHDVAALQGYVANRSTFDAAGGVSGWKSGRVPT